MAAAGRQLAALGLVHGTNGNVSARAGAHVAVSPTGAQLEALTAAARSSRSGDPQVNGPLAPTSEIALHMQVYARHDGAGAVVHTHAPSATALACVLDELPCLHYEMLALGGAIRVAPYRTFGTVELADVVVEALEGRTAALMANHGTLAYGTDMAGALRATTLLEWAADLYRRALAFGTPRTLDQADLDAVAAAVGERGYGTTKGVMR